MARILITTDYSTPGDEADLILTQAGHTTQHRLLKGLTADEIVAALDGIDGAIIAHDPLTADVLNRSGSLRAVVRSGVGYDSVDVEAATHQGISVSNLPGVNSNAVAEYTMGLLLTAARGLITSAVGVREGRWPRAAGHELRGGTLGLVGFGASARAIVPLAQAFGMTVLCVTSIPEDHLGVEFVDLPALLRRSDFVSLHTALTAKTRHLIDETALATMKPSAILVNTARGPIIDEVALADAVRNGRIAGAALDVVGTEPLPADSPLRGIDGITVYPHMAGQTVEARQTTAAEAARELVAALAGHPRSSLNQHLITAGKAGSPTKSEGPVR
jgi:phosphoglycerate dehydrogenase-like enzyme